MSGVTQRSSRFVATIHDDETVQTREVLHAMRNALMIVLGQVEAAGIQDAARLEAIRARGRELTELIGVLERASQMPVAPTIPNVLQSDRPLDTAPSDGADVAHAGESRDPRIGEVVDGCYHIIGEIGHGGMGKVLRAHDLHLDRAVALKVLSVEAWGSMDAKQVFLREARAMARVHHENVVTVHAFGRTGGRPYFVMDLVEGTDLDDHIRAQAGPMDVDEALAILDQMCRGVSAIHAQGIVHRDLKPGNVLIGPLFRVAVTDFGLTTRIDSEAESAVRGGTPGYMAPETIGTDASPDPRADVYALGVIAREMLTGARVFSGETSRDIATQQLEGPAEPFVLSADAGPPALAPVIDRAMALAPEDRFPSVEAFRSALHAARAGWLRGYEGTHVFIVDDHAEVLERVKAIVSEALPGTVIHAFESAEEAVVVAKRTRVDLALVDLDMPSVNGVELTAILRGIDEATRVIVVTGVGGADDWQTLQRIGASAFMVKPVEPAALGALVRKYLVARKRSNPEVVAESAS